MWRTVSAKLTAASALAVAVVVAMAALNLYAQHELLKRARSIAASVESVRLVTAVRASLARARRFEQAAMVAAAHPDLMELRAAEWGTSMQETRSALQGLQAGLPPETQQHRVIGDAAVQLEAYGRGFDETVDAVKKGLLADASAADGTMTTAREQADAADLAIAELAQVLVQRSDEARQQMGVAASTAQRFSVVLLVVFSAAALGGSLLMRRAILRPLGQALGVARRVAAGDLSRFACPPRQDEFGLLLVALEEMRDQLHGLVSGVRESVDSVALAAAEIAGGNADLSHRTEVQAASLQAAVASVQRVLDSIRASAREAQGGSASAQTMFAAAEVDGHNVRQVVETMQRILESTRRIEQITQLIDAIALQTHILGLNAAVEASNAGERGRGFAVVASNVRELADNCRNAAAEARRLVAEAEAQADSGMTLAHRASEAIAALVASASTVSQQFSSISHAAAEQRDTIEAIGSSMAEIDGATQQNAALVEEAAAAAESLKEQAGRLADSVSAFKLA